MFITNYKIKDSVYCLYKVRSKIYKKKAPERIVAKVWQLGSREKGMDAKRKFIQLMFTSDSVLLAVLN